MIKGVSVDGYFDGVVWVVELFGVVVEEGMDCCGVFVVFVEGCEVV